MATLNCFVTNRLRYYLFLGTQVECFLQVEVPYDSRYIESNAITSKSASKSINIKKDFLAFKEDVVKYLQDGAHTIKSTQILLSHLLINDTIRVSESCVPRTHVVLNTHLYRFFYIHSFTAYIFCLTFQDKNFREAPFKEDCGKIVSVWLSSQPVYDICWKSSESRILKYINSSCKWNIGCLSGSIQDMRMWYWIKDNQCWDLFHEVKLTPVDIWSQGLQ